MPSPSPVRLHALAWLLAIVSAVLIVACGSLILVTTRRMSWNRTTTANDQPFPSTASPKIPGMMAKSAATALAVPMMPPLPPTPVPTGAGAQDRQSMAPKIIKTGSLSLRVHQLDPAVDRLKTLAASLGGFVANSQTYNINGLRSATITLRISAAQFDAAVSAAKTLASAVLEENSTAQDVTAQAIDLEARLHAAQAEEVQYLEIMKHALTVDDTLRVSQQLANVRSRIEQLQGERRYLAEQTDFATLTVSLTEDTPVQVPSGNWRPLETLRRALHDLVQASQIAIDVAITVIVFIIGLLLPIVLIIAAFLWLLRAAWRRWFDKK